MSCDDERSALCGHIAVSDDGSDIPRDRIAGSRAGTCEIESQRAAPLGGNRNLSSSGNGQGFDLSSAICQDIQVRSSQHLGVADRGADIASNRIDCDRMPTVRLMSVAEVPPLLTISSANPTPPASA